ncbi:TetR/AcrR family transcriptional regulator [Flaviaesturariibacter amylovorans]|uniref:TetR/AcrR family transcriptional regulator n=1 Tax=Flaviaesturariibacter amylovorans TaxID=1084520 RepID=A0ABP8G4Q7_9BACT
MEPKERILVKAHELFNRYGIRSVSMDDIATQTGMSKKTLYQYYADKEELVNAVFSGVMEDNKHNCGRSLEHSDNAIHEVFLAFDGVQEMFENMNPSVLFDMEKYHAPTYSKFKAYQNDFLAGTLRANIERGIREELYRDDFDIDIMVRYRLFSMMQAFNLDVFPASRNNLVHVQRELLEVFLYGIATAKGVKLVQRYKKQRSTIKSDR